MKCVCVCSPVECVGVQLYDFQRSGIRFIRQLMNRQPLFILPYYANLQMHRQNEVISAPRQIKLINWQHKTCAATRRQEREKNDCFSLCVKKNKKNTKRLAWASTCQREMEVFPSYPGLNCRATERGPMLEMAKLVGGPGNSVEAEGVGRTDWK